MGDFLLEWSKNPTTRKLMQTVGVPTPVDLRRGEGAWPERPLEGRTVGFGGGNGLRAAAASALAKAGATVLADGDLTPFTAAAEAFGRAAGPLPEGGEQRYEALVFDGSDIDTPAGLRAAFDFFHTRVRSVASSGRIVVLGRPTADLEPCHAASQGALLGFVKSLGKETGRKGTTVNLIRVAAGAEDRLAGPLRWLLMPHSAYVSGQAIDVSGRAPARDEAWARPLDGRLAVVTGAARGIGKATARRLSDEGARVLLVDRPDDAQLGGDVARGLGGTFLGLDVTDPEAPEKLAEACDALGGCDVIVHNAGITRDKTLAKMKPELWDVTIAVNLEAVRTLQGRLKLNPGGSVICLSSIAGIAGNPGQTNYSASKSALVPFVDRLAPQLAEHGVRINAIAPGFIETRLTAAIPVATREVARRLCSLGQGGRPVDIAEAVVFLASPGASGVTGTTLRVCGQNFVGA